MIRRKITACAVGLAVLFAQYLANTSHAQAPSDFTFHPPGGVISQARVHLIFWLPPGTYFEPSGQGSNDQFESLIRRFFDDVAGSPYLGVAEQYSYDQNGTLVPGGPITNNLSVADTFLDPDPFPHPPTSLAPLTDSDVAAEVASVATSQGWQLGPDDLLFIFIGVDPLYQNAVVCPPAGANGVCTAAAHSRVPIGGVLVPYAFLSTPICADCGATGASRGTPTAHGDWVADQAAADVAHELLEAMALGWFNDVIGQATGEIMDLCDAQPLQPTVLGADTFDLYPIWSQFDRACVYSTAYQYVPPTPTPTPIPTPTPAPPTAQVKLAHKILRPQQAQTVIVHTIPEYDVEVSVRPAHGKRLHYGGTAGPHGVLRWTYKQPDLEASIKQETVQVTVVVTGPNSMTYRVVRTYRVTSSR